MVCPDDAFILRQVIPLITEDALAPKYVRAVQLQDTEKAGYFATLQKYDL